MNPVGKALWYIESHFAGEIALDEIAAVTGVSRYHLCRAFGAATGCPVMHYVRARRLSEGARALAAGACDILAVALNAGYGSHEAFTRASRDQFGTTPEAVRAQRHLRNLSLVEPIKMMKPSSPTSRRRASRTAGRCSSPDWASATTARAARAFPRNGSASRRISARSPGRSAG